MNSHHVDLADSPLTFPHSNDPHILRTRDPASCRCELQFERLAVCCGLFSLCLSLGDARAAPPQLADIVAQLTRTQHMLFEQCDSFRIVYSRTGKQTHLPSEVSGGGFLVEYILARKGDVWRFQRRFLEPGDVQVNAKTIHIPNGTETIIVKDGLWLSWDTARKSVFVNRFTSGVDFHPATVYFMFLGIDLVWQVTSDMLPSADYGQIQKESRKYLDHPFLPTHIQMNDSKYSIHPDRESIDGFPCWVVEYPGMDQLWIDTQHGCSIRRRVYHWSPGGPLKCEIRNSDYEEVQPGLWLPMLQTVDSYANIRGEKKELWGHLICTEKYEVQEIAFNSLTDSDIAGLDLPEGVEVADIPQGFVYRTGHGADPFAGPIPEGQKWLRFSKNRAILIMATSLLSLIAVIVLVVRQKRRKSTTRAKLGGSK